MDRGLDWEEQRKKALIRDHYTCRKCWKKTKSVHHLYPYRSNGHHNRLNNLTTLCGSCHRKEEMNFIKYGMTNWMKRQVKTNQKLGLKSLLNK